MTRCGCLPESDSPISFKLKGKYLVYVMLCDTCGHSYQLKIKVSDIEIIKRMNERMQ